MPSLHATPAAANTARHDDAHLERVYRAVLDLFELPEPRPFDYASLDPELLPIGSAKIPCACGCGDTLVRIDESEAGVCLGHAGVEVRTAGDDEDRERREECRLHLDEDAWWQGFCLGEEFVIADPPTGMSGHQRRAFRSGYEAGRKEVEAEMAEFHARYEAETLEMMMNDPDIESRYHDAELSDANISRKAV